MFYFKIPMFRHLDSGGSIRANAINHHRCARARAYAPRLSARTLRSAKIMVRALRVKQWRNERGQRTTPAVTVQPRGERKPPSLSLPCSSLIFSPPLSFPSAHHSGFLADACVTLVPVRRSCGSPLPASLFSCRALLPLR